MTNLKRGFITLASVALAVAVASPTLAADETPSAEDTEIEGVTWLLQLQAVGDTLAEIPEGIRVTLLMQDGRAGGNGGCNRYNTTYVLDGESIAFGPVASTLMACAEPAGTVEADYLANLAGASSWASDGSTLTFYSTAGDELLQYQAAPPASVVGSWQALGLNNDTGGVSMSAQVSTITAEFEPDGQLNGFDGCNNYFTTYELNGNAISISDAIGSTKMACASDELADQVQLYYAALTAATTWSVGDGGDLQLRDDSGSLLVEYVPAEG